MKTPARWIASAVVCACAISLAHGQAALPAPQTQGDVTYLNGGAGDEEVTFIKQSMKDYTMALAFSHAGTPRAEYVASVSITVKDARGATVFEASSVGPYLLLKLPAGKYSVLASYHDVTQTRPVSAAKAGALVTFVWQ